MRQLFYKNKCLQRMGDKSSIINIYRGRIRSRFQVSKSSFHVNIHLNPILLKKKKNGETYDTTTRFSLSRFFHLHVLEGLIAISHSTKFHPLSDSLSTQAHFPIQTLFLSSFRFQWFIKTPCLVTEKKTVLLLLRIVCFCFSFVVVVDVQLWIPIHLLPWFYVENRRLRMKSHSL